MATFFIPRLKRWHAGAFNTTTGPAHWELLQRARAVDNQVFVATCSPARDPDFSYQVWPADPALCLMHTCWSRTIQGD